ncbi:uncharacterized protein LOC142523886 [Primulina tabacum]|uniref:uncharacterized protein LOC142523886 n=1 Tax=Primulina tabacum TaxID=48773 RepID=UPI003F598066
MTENREDARYNPPDAIPIRDHFRPVINTHYSGIARGTINANNFELKPALINMVQQNQFAGTATADPHVHLRTFLEITDTVKINNVSDDIIRLRLFPFFLRDQARGWLQSLPLGSITTWQELATKFLSKYFPPAKSAQLKIEISTFRQNDFEQLYEAWERYKELLRRCLNHGFEDWMTINSYQWPSERSGVQRTAGVYAVDPITSLTAQVSALTTQIATMNKVSTSNSEGPSLVVEEPHFLEEAQYINNRNVGGFGGYRGKPSFEDLVGTFVVESGKRMSRTESRLDNLETHMASIGAILKILESQVDREEKEVELTPVRDEKLSPTKRARDQVEGEVTEGTRRNLPQKLLDPGEFILPCEIGGHLVEKAICDSGASINIMPSSIYEKLGLSRIKPTELSLQLADKSVKVPLDIVEDVELKIDKLKVLAEFVVLDMENSQDVHVILGRPLLAVVGAIIDVKRGKMTMEVEDQMVAIKASKKSYDPP